MNTDRGFVKNPDEIGVNDKIVIPDFCPVRLGCSRADDCPHISASVCSPGTCAEDDPSFVCSCAAPGVEPSGAPVCGGRYANDTCVTGCKMSDPCRSFSCVNGTCNSDGGVPRCNCLAGFVEQNANVCVDKCDPNPCTGGRCERVATGARFRCDCYAGLFPSTDTLCLPRPSSKTRTSAQSPEITTVSRPSSTTSAILTSDSTLSSSGANPDTAPSGTLSVSNGETSFSNVTTSNNLGADTVSDGESSSTTIAIVASVVGVMLLALIGAFVFWWRSKSTISETKSDFGTNLSVGTYGAVPRTDVPANVSDRYGAAPQSSEVAAIPPATYDVAPPEQSTSSKNQYTPAPLNPWHAT